MTDARQQTHCSICLSVILMGAALGTVGALIFTAVMLYGMTGGFAW
jgi:hypothetical protein